MIQRFLPLALLLGLPSQWLLWNVGSITIPHPYLMAALLTSGIVGGAGCIVIGLSQAPRQGHGKRCLVLFLGLVLLGSAAGFVYAVLSNEAGDVTVMHQLPPVAGPVNTLRIVTLNVLHGFPDFKDQEKRFRSTLREFRGLKADILVLQEAWSTRNHGSMAERLAKELGMNYAYARANGSLALLGFEEGSAILSRYPLVKARRELLKPKEPFWENRIALLADIDLGGEIVTAVGVHLSTSIPDTQVKSLLSILPKKNILFVAGDFNAAPDSDAIMDMGRFGHTRVDPKQSRVCYFSDTVNQLPKERIDHIFLTPESQRDWVVENSMYILTSLDVQPCDWRPQISDHDAIVVELRRRR